MRCPAKVLLAIVWLGLSAQVQAQDISVVIAFGDSITRGDSRFDGQNRGGYPGRLQSKMRADNPDARVLNYGRDGETTAGGVSRISAVLSAEPNADALALMEGTNDIDAIIEGEISLSSVVANLGAIGNRGAAAGLEVFNATIIPRPPSARRDFRNELTFGLVREIRDLAYRQVHPLVDPYDELIFTPGVFGTLYNQASDDLVGHPNAAGFAVLADLFFDVISGVDSRGPVPGDLVPGYRVSTIGPANDIELTIYDLGAGIDRDNTSLTINGVAVETTQTGNSRRRKLSHDTTAASLGCHAKVGIRSSDLNDPPNVTDRVFKEFRVNGGMIVRGDLDKSCRVDGIDLLILALAFGSRTGEARYSLTADINNDGVVNGMDFALMADNFGRSS